jgi:hypothetical protein
MTDEEKRQQKASLLLECQEAENNLAELKEKAKRRAQAVHSIERWLKHLSGQSVPDYGEDLSKIGVMIGANLARYKQELNLDDAFALAAEIKNAETLLADLRNRKQDLGLR